MKSDLKLIDLLKATAKHLSETNKKINMPELKSSGVFGYEARPNDVQSGGPASLRQSTTTLSSC
ncbi:MAG: hypothetical protein QM802_06545 [Agriterribacter sp.]